MKKEWSFFGALFLDALYRSLKYIQSRLPPGVDSCFTSVTAYPYRTGIPAKAFVYRYHAGPSTTTGNMLFCAVRYRNAAFTAGAQNHHH